MGQDEEKPVRNVLELAKTVIVAFGGGSLIGPLTIKKVAYFGGGALTGKAGDKIVNTVTTQRYGAPQGQIQGPFGFYVGKQHIIPYLGKGRVIYKMWGLFFT